jgi:hypothetical protein
MSFKVSTASKRPFQNYRSAKALGSYDEIEYLIAPGLGPGRGIRPLRNALEQRLHEMVCGGKARFSDGKARYRHWFDCGLSEVFPYGSTSCPAFAPRISECRRVW